MCCCIWGIKSEVLNVITALSGEISGCISMINMKLWEQFYSKQMFYIFSIRSGDREMLCPNFTFPPITK